MKKNKDEEKKKNKKLKKEKKIMEQVENIIKQRQEIAENDSHCNCDDSHSNCQGNQDDSSGDEMCLVKHIHNGSVELVKDRMPQEEMLVNLADLFKVFGDSTRTKIISALFVQELCVCDIAEIVNMSISAVSHQLRILRNTKIVKNRKVGKEVFYTLDDNHIYQIFQMGLAHLTE